MTEDKNKENNNVSDSMTEPSSKPIDKKSSSTDKANQQDDSLSSPNETIEPDTHQTKNNEAIEQSSDEVLNELDDTLQDKPHVENDDTLNVSGGHSESQQVTKSKLGLVALILAFLAFIIAGWMGYQQWQQQILTAESVTEQNESLSRQNNLLNQFKQSLNDQSSAQREQNEQVSRLLDQQSLLRQQLAVTQDKLRLLSNKGRQEWLIEQALYQLRVAQQKLVFEHQLDTAMALMAQADMTLAQANDIHLSTIRQAINQDITEVSTFPKVDTEGLLYRLEALQQQMEKLEPVALQLPDIAIDQPKQNKAWFDELKSTLNDFGDKAFKFRTHDDKVQPLLTEEQKQVLHVVLQLALTQAQSAVLRNDQKYYVSRLTFVETMIEKYFQLNENAEAIRLLIQQLKTENVIQTIDYQLTSLPLLIDLNEQRRLQWYSEQNTQSEEDGL